MIYFDTSFVVPLILREATSGQIETFVMSQRDEVLAISHWTRIEVSSVLAREVRMRKISRPAARAAEAEFDDIAAETLHVLSPSTQDFELAGRYLQHYETGLRAGDALHLAIASNHQAATTYSLDNKVLKAGRRLGLRVSTLPSRAG